MRNETLSFGFSRKLIPAALLLMSAPTLAQDADLPMLGEMVVTASRIKQSTLDAPANVSVVSAETLQETGAARVTDALVAKVPGFYFRGPTGISDRITTGSTHSLRGQSMTGVKFMLDGVGLGDGGAGQNRNLVGIEMDDIERIEVVPGVSSALYGSDAIGGVVNIITKIPTKQEINFKYTHGFDEVKRDAYSASFRNRWENGLAASLSLGHEDRDGSRKQNQAWSTTASYASRNPKEVSTDTAGKPSYLIGDKGAIPSRVSRVNGKLYYELDPKSRFYAGFGYYEAKMGYSNYRQYVSGAPITGTTLWNTANPSYNEESRYFAGYDGKLGQNFDLKASISHARQKQYSVSATTSSCGASCATYDAGLGVQNSLPSNTLDGSVQLGFNAGERQYLILGIASTRGELNKKYHVVSDWRHPESSHTGILNDKTDGDSRINAFFIQDQVFVTDALTLYVGGRYDKWSSEGSVANTLTQHRKVESKTSKSAFSPKLAAVYRWDDTLSFRSSIGKAFHAPTNSELYAMSRSATGGQVRLLLPGSGVKPETATAIDLGVEKALPGNGFIKAAIYRTKLKDMLYRTLSLYDGAYDDIVGSNDFTHYAKMSNVAESLTKGIELSGEIPLASWLRASASYTYTDARITKDESGMTSLKGKFVRYVPKNMASIGFDAKWRDWSGNLMTTYVGKRYGSEDNSDRVQDVFGGASKYWLSNLRVGYRIDRHFTATLAINNLFDEKYYDYYLMPERNLALELRGSF